MTGSRTWNNRDVIDGAFLSVRAMNEYDLPVTLIHGAAAGADTMAESVAKELGWNIEAHPADWRTHTEACPTWHLDLERCRMAGHRRNQEMVDSRADVCFAFIKAESPGATSCADKAIAAGIPTVIYREE